jgi:hypothetical protein
MPKRATSGSFTKGDKRINRDGRPKNSTDLSALFRRIGAEVATKKNGEPITGPDGRPMTVLEAIARQWAQNPKQQGDFVDRAYGKVPQQQQHSGEGGGAIEHKVVVIFDGNAGNTPPADDNAATGD